MHPEKMILASRCLLDRGLQFQAAVIAPKHLQKYFLIDVISYGKNISNPRIFYNDQHWGLWTLGWIKKLALYHFVG
jgi:hypothetical protein